MRGLTRAGRCPALHSRHMLERYVLLKLASDCATRTELDDLAEKASSTFPTMDGVCEFRVAKQNQSAGSSPWHLAFTISFADSAAHERYMRCPIHRDFDGELAMILEDIQSFLLERHV